MKNLSKLIYLFKERLFFADSGHALSKFSLAILISLDLFVFFSISDGLRTHTRQLAKVTEKFPYTCTSIVNRGSLNRADLNWVQGLALNKNFLGKMVARSSSLQKLHPTCQKIYEQIEIIEKDQNLEQAFRTRRAKQQLQRNLKREVRQNKGVYDTGLLEKISGNKAKIVTEGKFAKKMREATNRAIRLDDEIEQLSAEIKNDSVYRDFILFLKSLQTEKESYKSDLSSAKRWFSIKKMFWEYLFLIPLLVFFLLWHKLSLKKQRPLQALVSAHLVLVAFLPVLFKLFETILNIIPKVFLTSLMALLKALNLVALWHYIVIFLAIVAAGWIIYLVQTKIYSKERMALKRLQEQKCFSCGAKLRSILDRACCNCGAIQLEECAHCGQDRPVAAKHCTHCGNI